MLACGGYESHTSQIDPEEFSYAHADNKIHKVLRQALNIGTWKDNVKKELVLILMLIMIPIVVTFSSLPSFAEENVGNLQSRSVPVYGYEIINIYPHDNTTFTEGLVYDGKTLYESTGLYGKSTLRQVDLKTGRILKLHRLPEEFFGEGLTLWKDQMIQLTWKSRIGFVYNKESFNQTRSFSYPKDGWGLTSDGQRLIMSDGSDTLYFLNPDTFEEIGSIRVKDNSIPVDKLNELEFIKGNVYANVWYTSRIAIISSETGEVTGYIDLQGLVDRERGLGDVDVLNGIAYEADKDLLLVTGKLWPELFEIKIQPEA
jgi:glutamine cyclotransferase